jgi:hypothetical protein
MIKSKAKLKILIVIMLLFSLQLTACQQQSTSKNTKKSSNALTLKELGKKLEANHQNGEIRKKIAHSAEKKTYIVSAHWQELADKLRSDYSSAQLQAFKTQTKQERKISVVRKTYGTFVQAAATVDSSKIAKQTNYNAIWMRDSLWCVLALNANSKTKAEAKAVLLTQLDYLISQKKRILADIADPSLLLNENGDMNAIHIRFDANSQTFADVQENHVDQHWNHKQNDALGLLLGTTLDLLNNGDLTLADLKANQRLDGLALLIGYLQAVKFYQMEDSGTWEEAARLNTSSVGLVTSAFEKCQNLLKTKADFAEALKQAADPYKLTSILSDESLSESIDKGYERVRKQLAQGGESPDYSSTDSRYRTADAALLNLIFPAQLNRLTLNEKKRVLEIVRTLVREKGVLRYINDTYQAGNFWYDHIATDTNEKNIKKRENSFIADSEAQWFFDSWLAKTSAILYKETKDPVDWAHAIQHLNRSLGQITGEENYGANGTIVPAYLPPESYNTLVIGKKIYHVPSPITPLNWAKASQTLMFEEMIQR